MSLPSVSERVHHAIDYAGAVLLAVGLSGIVLMTSLGGTSYEWASAQIVGLGVIGVAGLAAFVFAESRAAEPILPLHLFRNRVFRVTSAIGFVIGFALFGALTYLPLFQQVVRGDTPTESGLQLIPVMAGVLIGSIGSGQVISATGRYKVFPIVGTATAALGMLLLSRLDAGTSTLYATRRDVRDGPRARARDAGARAGRAERRRLRRARRRDLRRDAVPLDGRLARHGGARRDLHEPAHERARRLARRAGRQRLDRPERRASGCRPRCATPTPSAFTDSLSTVFLVAAAIVLVAFLLSWLIEERPLRQTVETAGVGEAFASPTSGDSLKELTRELGRLVGRERTRAFIERTVDAADVDLPPGEAWLLVQGEEGLALRRSRGDRGRPPVRRGARGRAARRARRARPRPRRRAHRDPATPRPRG